MNYDNVIVTYPIRRKPHKISKREEKIMEYKKGNRQYYNKYIQMQIQQNNQNKCMQDWNHKISQNSPYYTLKDIYKQQDLGDVYAISIDSGWFNYYNDQRGVNLKGIQTLSSLRILYVNGCNMPCVDLAIICQLNIEILNLKDNYIKSFKNYQARNATAKTLDFSSNLITDLKFAQCFISIEEIDVSKCCPNNYYNTKDEEQQFLVLNSIYYLCMHPNLRTINLGFGELIQHPDVLAQNKYNMPDIANQIEYIAQRKPVSESPFQQEIKSIEVRKYLKATVLSVNYIREAKKRREELRGNVTAVRAKLVKMFEVLRQFE